MRGLKLAVSTFAVALGAVAPYLGAWIETKSASFLKRETGVAPYLGAWIETD